jgi:hypothetical protein
MNKHKRPPSLSHQPSAARPDFARTKPLHGQAFTLLSLSGQAGTGQSLYMGLAGTAIALIRLYTGSTLANGLCTGFTLAGRDLVVKSLALDDSDTVSSPPSSGTNSRYENTCSESALNSCKGQA